MGMTQLFLRHNNLYAAARMTGAYTLYNNLLHLKNGTKEGEAGGEGYEPDTSDYIRKRLKPSDDFIDCGANVGYFSLLASKVASRGRVFAFEPVNSTFRKLEARIKGRANIKAIRKAVGDREGRAMINTSADAGRDSLVAIAGTGREEIEITTLDSEFPKGLPRLRIIKIDVEGMEKEAIDGARRLLGSQKPDVIFEFNYSLLYSKNRRYDEAFQALRSSGYTSFTELATGKRVESHRDLSDSCTNILARP